MSESKIHQEIDAALLSHVAWKNRLRTAALNGETTISVDDIKRDDKCQFGKWLASLDPKEQHHYHYEHVKDLHAKFHLNAGDIAQLIADGKSQQALSALNGEAYNMSSLQLSSALMEWKRHC